MVLPIPATLTIKLLTVTDVLIKPLKVRNVAAIPGPIVEAIVFAIPILTNVSPTETTGTFVSFPVIDSELPAPTPDIESTKITVDPIPTV